MQRITITIDDDLLETIDALAARKGYATRSEAMRDLIRSAAASEAAAQGDAPCIGVLDYVYDHETRTLAQRLAATFHAHHDLSVSSMHLHLDRGRCLEIAVLAGPLSEIRALADAVTAQRGVRHGHLHVVPEATISRHHHHPPHEHD
ncbi:MAG: nickel-responsive transcriptional regulator NikR [Methylacidiphilales bacterium]|nr:nickel-responsive transcriptional regulator NikR [Candidatus Methylacidiphilales bacterium]